MDTWTVLYWGFVTPVGAWFIWRGIRRGRIRTRLWRRERQAYLRGERRDGR